VVGKAYKIISKDGLHGMMSMAYVIRIQCAIVVQLVARIERVLRVVCLDLGFGLVRQETAITSLGFETVGLRRKWPLFHLSLDVLRLFRGCCARRRFKLSTLNQTSCTKPNYNQNGQ
jgi:hypothetical protein